MNDGSLLVGGRARFGRTFPSLPTTVFVEPAPALVTSVQHPDKLLRGAWLWAVRKVLKLKVSDDDKGQFAVRRDDREKALSIFAEKNIAPAVWIAWRARVFVHNPSHPPSLGWLLGTSLLAEPARRGWFRNSTAGMFGGRSAPTKTQAFVLERWALARALWTRGADEDEAFERAGLAPAQFDLLAVTIRNEEERARARCAVRAAGGDPMPVSAPSEWEFASKESRA